MPTFDREPTPIEAIVESPAFRAAQRALGDARGAIDAATTAALGRDFEDRLARVVRRYASEHGTDPFGFDPAWAKYAIGVAATFHRFWFRTEVHGIEHVPEGRP